LIEKNEIEKIKLSDINKNMLNWWEIMVKRKLSGNNSWEIGYISSYWKVKIKSLEVSTHKSLMVIQTDVKLKDFSKEYNWEIIDYKDNWLIFIDCNDETKIIVKKGDNVKIYEIIE